MRRVVFGLLMIIPLWLGATDGGIQVSDNPPGGRAQLFPQIVKTTDGGCVIAWEDNRQIGTSSRFEIRAQKLNYQGQRQWTSGDILISSGFDDGHRMSLSMCEDGSQGAYIAFVNKDSTINNKLPGVYIQHVDNSGPTWTNPVAVYTTNRWEFKGLPGRITSICPDNNGGCWVAFVYGKQSTIPPATTVASYYGVKVCHVDINGTVKEAFDTYNPELFEFWKYNFITPSVCAYADSVMLAYSNWLMIGSSSVYVTKIYPTDANWEFYHAIPYSTIQTYLGDPFSPLGSGYGKCLDVHISKGNTPIFHIVSRGGELKCDETGEKVFYHAHELGIYYSQLDAGSGVVVSHAMASEHKGVAPTTSGKVFWPVEEMNLGVPLIVDNEGSGTTFTCIFPARDNGKNSIKIRTGISTPSSLPSWGWNTHLPDVIQNPGGPTAAGCFLVACDYPTEDWAEDLPIHQNSNIYLVRLNAAGTIANSPWNDRKSVCEKYGPQSSPKLALINNDNYIAVVWADKRDDSWNRWKIFAQCYSISTGQPVW